MLGARCRLGVMLGLLTGCELVAGPIDYRVKRHDSGEGLGGGGAGAGEGSGAGGDAGVAGSGGAPPCLFGTSWKSEGGVMRKSLARRVRPTGRPHPSAPSHVSETVSGFAAPRQTLNPG